MIRFVTFLCTLLLTVNATAKTEQVHFDAADGVRIYGDIYRSAGGDNAPVVLLFHQSGGDARGEYTQIAMRLMQNGYNVLAIDQRAGGDRFGGGNRTMAALDGQEYGYCDAYPDLEAALRYMRTEGFDGRLAVWGSSYSAALAFQLVVKNSDEVSALLGFSPASGSPLADCSLLPYMSQIDVPALALRPQSEFENESVQAQMKEFEAHGIQTYVADPGVHGSSMLNAERVGESTESTWIVVLDFLAATLRDE
jgi:dienelactone hydrolase